MVPKNRVTMSHWSWGITALCCYMVSLPSFEFQGARVYTSPEFKRYEQALWYWGIRTCGIMAMMTFRNRNRAQYRESLIFPHATIILRKNVTRYAGVVIYIIVFQHKKKSKRVLFFLVFKKKP